MKKTDPRHNARIAVLQKLFERHFRQGDITKASPLEFDIPELIEINETDFDENLFNKLLEGTVNNFGKCDEIIKDLAPEWPLEMINRVDLQILRLAIFEGFIGQINPVKVVIDEAIELAKEFGGSPSAKFINGVLGNLITDEKLKEELKNDN